MPFRRTYYNSRLNFTECCENPNVFKKTNVSHTQKNTISTKSKWFPKNPRHSIPSQDVCRDEWFLGFNFSLGFKLQRYVNSMISIQVIAPQAIFLGFYHLLHQIYVFETRILIGFFDSISPNAGPKSKWFLKNPSGFL